MLFVRIAVRNAQRSPMRGAMTILAVAITLVAFVLLRTVSAGWTQRIAQTPNNRVVTRHKLSYGETIPVHYAEVIRQVPGVQLAMGGMWIGAKLPGDNGVFFDSFAVEAEPFIAMHYELVAPEDQKRAFVENRRGAMVSKDLAAEFGWKVGDRVQLDSRNLPGSRQAEVSGIYESPREGFAQRTVWMHWDYINETLDAGDRDRLGFVAAQIANPDEGADIARRIDIQLDASDPPTLSQEDRVLRAALVGRFAAILDALDVLSFFILGVVLLILGNTIGMSVAERTKEYATLRAIGFLPRHLAALVFGEAAALGLVGGGLGLALAYPIVESSMSRFLQDNLNFAPLRVPTQTAWASLILAVGIALLAAGASARRVARLSVTDGLHHIA